MSKACRGAAFQVIRPGWLTLVQDLGRSGYQRFGMPVGGAMDPVALRLANRLVGNPDSAAALEMTVQGPALLFEQAAVIALAGADLSPWLDGRPAPNGTAIAVGRGSHLTFGERRSGARGYLAVAGGIDVPLQLRSRSTHVASGTGGYAGRPLAAGDRLVCGPPGAAAGQRIGQGLPPSLRPDYSAQPLVRAVVGPQADRFSPDALDRLIDAPYRLTPQSDRMGYRLYGQPLATSGATDLISDAVPPGAIQVPPDRQPILMMADRQTTGGYPKIAVVITADLPLAAQLLPGHTLRFTLVEPAEARAALLAQRAALDAALPPIGNGRLIDGEELSIGRDQ